MLLSPTKPGAGYERKPTAQSIQRRVSFPAIPNPNKNVVQPGFWDGVTGLYSAAYSAISNTFFNPGVQPPPAPPLPPVPVVPPPVHIQGVRLVRAQHGIRSREFRITPAHFKTRREMRAYVNLDNEVLVRSQAGQVKVTTTRVRQAIQQATGLDLPIVGDAFDPGIYELTFYSDFSFAEWTLLDTWQKKVEQHLKGGAYPGQRPALAGLPGAPPHRVYLEAPSGLPLRLRVAIALYGQGKVEAERAETQFRIHQRDRFRQAARAATLNWKSIFTQKFRDDHLGFDRGSAVAKVATRLDATAPLNHVIYLDLSGANRHQWEGLIDFVGSMNLQMMFEPGVDYRTPMKLLVFEYDNSEGRITREVGAYVWFQMRSDEGIMKIHHLSGIETDRGYVGQVKKAGRITRNIQSMRNLDVTDPRLN